MKKKYVTKIIALAVIATCIAGFNPIGVKADSYTYTDNVFSRYVKVNDSKIKFTKNDGTFARNEWIHQQGYTTTWGNYSEWIYFGDDCLNKDGWFMVDGKWYFSDQAHGSDSYGINTNGFSGDYYLGADGAMLTGWFKDNIYEKGKYKGYYWYFSDESGKILKNTTTPDGYKVDAKGRWIQ